MSTGGWCTDALDPTEGATPALTDNETTQDIVAQIAMVRAELAARALAQAAQAAESPACETGSSVGGAPRSTHKTGKESTELMVPGPVVAFNDTPARKRQRAEAESMARRQRGAAFFREPETISLEKPPGRASLVYARLDRDEALWQVSTSELYEFFGRFGLVHRIYQHPARASHGTIPTQYVLVHYYAVAAAKYAVMRLHRHHRVPGCDATLVMQLARPRESGEGGEGASSGFVRSAVALPVSKCVELCNYYLGFDGISFGVVCPPTRDDAGAAWRCRAEVKFKYGPGGHQLVVAGDGVISDDDDIHKLYAGGGITARRGNLRKAVYSLALQGVFAAVELRVRVNENGQTDNYAALAPGRTGDDGGCVHGDDDDEFEFAAIRTGTVFRNGTPFTVTLKDDGSSSDEDADFDDDAAAAAVAAAESADAATMNV